MFRIGAKVDALGDGGGVGSESVGSHDLPVDETDEKRTQLVHVRLGDVAKFLAGSHTATNSMPEAWNAASWTAGMASRSPSSYGRIASFDDGMDRHARDRRRVTLRRYGRSEALPVE